MDNQTSGDTLQDSTQPLSGKIAISQLSTHEWITFNSFNSYCRFIVSTQIVPDSSSDRCRVVIDGCKVDQPYTVAVAALPPGMSVKYFVSVAHNN